MYRIMIAEDEPLIAQSVCDALKAWGFDAYAVRDFERVEREFNKYKPHLLLLDLSLPVHNGFYWCARIRKSSRLPIVFLSSHAEGIDIVTAVNMGADDYIVKPVDMGVLIAKIQAMLRRSYDYQEPASSTFCGGASLDAGRSCVRVSDKRLDLTRNELKILQLLVESKGKIVSRERIMLALWDDMQFVDENTLSVNVNRLRKKLAELGLENAIQTHKGQGYRIDEDAV